MFYLSTQHQPHKEKNVNTFRNMADFINNAARFGAKKMAEIHADALARAF